MAARNGRLPVETRHWMSYTCMGLKGGVLACRLTLEFRDTMFDPQQNLRFEHEWSVPSEALDAGDDLDARLLERRAGEEYRFVERIENLLAESGTSLIGRRSGQILRMADEAA